MSNTEITLKQVGLKTFSLFSVVRGYNIITLVIAQYLASIFIFSPHKSLRFVLLDINLIISTDPWHLLFSSSQCCILFHR